MTFDGLDDREFESIALGGTVEETMNGDSYDISLKSQKASITSYQAKLLVDALSQYTADDERRQSIARKTQTQIRDQFDIQ